MRSDKRELRARASARVPGEGSRGEGGDVGGAHAPGGAPVGSETYHTSLHRAVPVLITELMEAAIPALEAMLALRWLGVQSAAALGAGYVAAHVCPAVVAAFLAVSTTTASTAMALSSNSQAPSTPDPSAQRRRRSSTVDVLGRALGAGCALALAAAMCAPTVLGTMGLSTLVLPHTQTYLAILALAMPLRMLVPVLKAAFHTKHDGRAPLVSSTVTIGMHVFVMLILRFAQPFGIKLTLTTLAVSSVVSQLVGFALLLRDALQQGMLCFDITSDTNQAEDALVLEDPLALVSALRWLGYGILSSFAVSLIPAAIAVHHIQLTTFVLLGLLTLPLHHAARAMLPRYVTSDTIQQELDARVFFPNSTIVLLRWLMVTAVLMGAVAAIVASAGLNLAVSWATLDINCIRLIKSTTPIVSLVYVLAPLTAVIEGAFISARNFGFQLRSQLFSLVAMILSLWGVLQLNSVGKLELSWIWGAYALHLITRLLVSFSWLAANMRFFRYIGKRKSGKLPDPFVFHE